MVAPLALAGIGAGVGLIGGLFDKHALDQANSANNARLKAIMEMFGRPGDRSDSTMFGRQRTLLDSAQSALGERVGILARGTRRALGEASLTESSMLRQLNQTTQIASAGAASSVMGRGLGSSSIASGAQSSVARAAGLTLRDIAGTIAQLRSGIVSQGAAAQASAVGDLANFFQGRSAQEIGLMMAQAQVLENVTDTAGGSIMDSIGGGVGMAAIANLFGED